MQSPERRLEFLNHLRGLAILWVFLFHCLGPAYGRHEYSWGPWFREIDGPSSFLFLLPASLGWAGVALFFVVSGFCIHLAFRQSTGGWSGFFARRAFRIYPPYLIALILFAVVWPATRLGFDSSGSWRQFTSHLVLIHSLDARTFFGINPSFWSIAVEAQLYLAYPALLAAVRWMGWSRALIALAVLEFSLRGVTGALLMWDSAIPYWLVGSPLYFWFSWAIGAAVADAWLKRQPLPFRRVPAPLWLVLAAGTSFVKPLATFSFPLFALWCAALIAGILDRGRGFRLPRPVLAHLGTLGLFSYSFYLIHQPLVFAIPAVLRQVGIDAVPPLAMFALCACSYPAILFLAGLGYRYIERYSIDAGKRVWRDPGRAGAPA